MALPPLKSGLKSSMKSNSTDKGLADEPVSEDPLLVQSPTGSADATKPALKTRKDTADTAVEENPEGFAMQKPSKENPLEPINRPPSPPEQKEGKVAAEDTDGPALDPLQPVPPSEPPHGDDENSKWSGLRAAVQVTRRRSAGLLKHAKPGGSGVVNPLKDTLINYGNREVDVNVVRDILEQNKSTIDTWIDLPLDCDGLSIMPSALIFSVGYTQVDVVAALCEYGANPKIGYHGKNSFNGWVKPDLPPSEIVMNRVGRFKGTMLGDDLQKILEILQAAEIRLASAGVQNIAKGIHSGGLVTDIYDIQGESLGIETDNIRLAMHKTSRETFAIKSEAKSSQEAGMWEELAIMRKVDHQHIIKLYDTFEDETHAHIVMELCSGGRLFTRIAEAGGIGTHVTCKFMQHMSAAVAYLHEQGICHRNIEPCSFIVKELGSSTLLQDATVMLGGSWCLREFSGDQPLKTDDHETCTLQCVSPELLAASGSLYTEKVDVWSLGVVFFILLSGSCPFQGDSERTVLKKIKKGAVNQTGYWANVQSTAQHLVQQMLTVDTQVRLTALQVVAHPYFQGHADKESGQPHTSEQLEVLFDFQPRKICVDTQLLRDIAPKTSVSMRLSKTTQAQETNVPHPLENIMRAKKINVKQLRAVLESMDDASFWIDKALDTSEENPLPPALIFALGKTQPDLVEVLLDHGADPLLQHQGSGSYSGWIKPGTKLSELVLGRRGRFIGTMVGDKLMKICELLQRAEANKATATVDSIMGKLTHTVSDPATVYNIQGVIGQSKTSITKKGVLKSGGESFAVKTEPKTSQDEVWEEFSIIQSMSHNNIIKLRETFEDQSSLYAILELCEGGSLASKLVDAQVPISSPEREGIENIMLQMGKAVEYIHSRNIAHRSLQPEHFLLLETTGALGAVTVKLIDFTFARDFGPNGRKMITRVCVPCYVAPEILTGDGQVAYNEKVDVWSLGVTFYAMTACAQPFAPVGDETEEDILQKVEQGEFDFKQPEEWPDHLAETRDLISKMLVVDVGSRLPASQVISVLEKMTK